MFVHNSVPEYRIEFWRLLQTKVELEILITNSGLDSEIYGLNRSTDGLKLLYFSTLSDLKRRISKCDVVILPPADSIKEIFIGCYILCNVSKEQKTIYWTEKWEAEKKWLTPKKKVKNYIQRIVIGNLARRCSGCVAAGTKSFEYLKGLKVSEESIQVAYDSSTSPQTALAIDFEKVYNIPSSAKVILYFGRIVERKGLLILLKAFQKLQNNNTYLLICGEGDFKPTCEKWVEVNNISHVIFAGKVQPSERINYYKRATVFVLPSYPSSGIIEAWGLTVNEALEAGCPVVATDAVGSSYDLLDGKSGIQIESCNVDAVATAIKNFEVNENVHIYCKNKAKQYSVEKMAEGFSKIIKKGSDV